MQPKPGKCTTVCEGKRCTLGTDRQGQGSQTGWDITITFST
jgi:hypothetical protein